MNGLKRDFRNLTPSAFARYPGRGSEMDMAQGPPEAHSGSRPGKLDLKQGKKGRDVRVAAVKRVVGRSNG